MNTHTPTSSITAPNESAVPSASGRAVSRGLMAVIVVAALGILATTVDGLRSGVLTLGQGPVADALPASFFGPAVLPDALVSNPGAVAVLGILVIVLCAAGIAVLHRAGGSTGDNGARG